MSNPLEDVTVYLIDKVGRVNVNNPKANSGAVLLRLSKEWEDTMSSYVTDAFVSLQQQFGRDSTDSPAGTAKLTNMSTVIGKTVSRRIQRDPLPWNMEVRLGDLFIESFEANGLIDLYYPKIRDGSYVISATHKWTELAEIPETLDRIRLTATTMDKPADIVSKVQMIGDREYPLVKGEDRRVTIDAPWVSAVNKLQHVAWRVNRRVLSALHKSRDMFVSDEPIEDNDAKEQKRRSKKLEWFFITGKAEMLKDADKFYQYLDTDYRGRFYYIEPFLTFQGSDVARGLMQFARAKPMTDEGLQWLAIHTASSFNMSYGIDEIPDWCEADYRTHLEKEGLDNISVDKMTLSDRIQWTNEYMKEIVDAGVRHEFSEDAEKPVAFLAACIEWADYHEAVSDERIHMSRLPIPIDGSNNGWQHLGAISKDPHTGRLVGLVPVEIQQDFYVQTAKKLIEMNDDEHLQSILDQMPMKKIRKGISKRGSMTRAYSAGQAKIGENMFFDCKTEDYHVDYGITEKDCLDLAGRLIKAIDLVCPGPLTTMGYLQDLASFEIGRYERYGPDGEPAGKLYKQMEARRKVLYTKDDLTDMEMEELDNLTKEVQQYYFEKVYGNGADYLEWTTPSGFHVRYENWIMQPSRCKGSVGKRRITHVAKLPTSKPDIRGFMCGVSPNFIHSMDASHMALVIADWKGEFGAVHDSFSTHASDVDDLLAKTKQVFIDMYDVDNFYQYIEDQLLTDKTGLDVEQPDLGTLDIGGINDSEYFFA